MSSTYKEALFKFPYAGNDCYNWYHLNDLDGSLSDTDTQTCWSGSSMKLEPVSLLSIFIGFNSSFISSNVWKKTRGQMWENCNALCFVGPVTGKAKVLCWAPHYLQYTNLCGGQVRLLALLQLLLWIDLSIEQSDSKAPWETEQNEETVLKGTARLWWMRKLSCLCAHPPMKQKI